MGAGGAGAAGKGGAYCCAMVGGWMREWMRVEGREGEREKGKRERESISAVMVGQAQQQQRSGRVRSALEGWRACFP